MLGLKNKPVIEISENEWENMDNFILNFAQNNEDVNGEKKGFEREFNAKENDRQNAGQLFDAPNAEPVKKASNNEAPDQDFAKSYNSLHSDINGLLQELDEIKRARINLQNRLNSIRS